MKMREKGLEQWEIKPMHCDREGGAWERARGGKGRTQSFLTEEGEKKNRAKLQSVGAGATTEK